MPAKYFFQIFFNTKTNKHRKILKSVYKSFKISVFDTCYTLVFQNSFFFNFIFIFILFTEAYKYTTITKIREKEGKRTHEKL